MHSKSICSHTNVPESAIFPTEVGSPEGSFLPPSDFANPKKPVGPMLPLAPVTPDAPEGTESAALDAEPHGAGASTNGRATDPAAVTPTMRTPTGTSDAVHRDGYSFLLEPIGTSPVPVPTGVFPTESSRTRSKRMRPTAKDRSPTVRDSDGASPPSNRATSAKGPDRLVPKRKFGRVDADYFADLIPKTSDPEGDRILRNRLQQQPEFIADVDAKGRLVSSFHEYRIREMTGQPILLRVRSFGSEEEAKEFVYASHDDGGQHFTPAALREMRHARVLNLLLMEMTVPEIARRTGLDTSTIRKIHKRKFPDVKRKDGRALPAEKMARAKEMIAQNRPPAQIAAEAAVSKATVSRLMNAVTKKPERIPKASEEGIAGKGRPQATEANDPEITAPEGNEPLDDAMPTDAGDDDLLPLDAFTRRALEQADISVETYLQVGRRGVLQYATDIIRRMKSEDDPVWVRELLAVAHDFHCISLNLLNREISKDLDERSKPHEKLADRKGGPKKKTVPDRKPL